MWTSLQNAQLDHIPTPPTLLTHKGPAYGLTRFACQHPFEINTMNSQYQVKNPAAKAAMRNTQNTICAAQLLLAAQPVTIDRNQRSRSPEYAQIKGWHLKCAVNVCERTEARRWWRSLPPLSRTHSGWISLVYRRISWLYSQVDAPPFCPRANQQSYMAASQSKSCWCRL